MPQKNTNRRLLGFEILESRRLLTNAPPSLDFIPDQVLVEGSFPVTVSLTGITAGGNESQPIRISTTSSNEDLIPTPSINYVSARTAGNLVIAPAPNSIGVSKIMVTVEDGGEDRDLETSGDNTTFSRSFIVFVGNSFREYGAELILDLTTSNQNVSVMANDNGYYFILSAGVWSGLSSPKIQGVGTSILKIASNGYSSIRIQDNGYNNSASFLDSGTNSFSSSIRVDFDRMDAGSILFSGATTFVGIASIYASTSKNISLASGTTLLSTQNGAINLSANMQLPKRNEAFRGIEVFGGKIKSVSGTISLLGTGGNGDPLVSSDNSGVVIDSGGSVKTKAGARIEILGASGKIQGCGVRIGNWNGITSSIEAEEGDIRITGYGSNGGHMNGQYGVVQFSSYISTGNQGGIVINGNGGTSSGFYNFGFASNGSLIRSFDGDIRITGVAGGGLSTEQGGSSDHGISIESGSQIISDGAGSIIASGTAGAGLNGNNIGFLIQGQSSNGQLALIKTNYGSININGQGGVANSIKGPDNDGVFINDRASLVTTGGGSIDVIGRAGVNRGCGVRIGLVNGDTSIGIKTIDGNISVTGYGSEGEDLDRSIGISVLFAKIEALGLGEIFINGIGGMARGGFNHGVLALGSVIASQLGDIYVTGTGGSSFGSYNYGVVNANSMITSAEGNIFMNGVGGMVFDDQQNRGSHDHGFVLESGGKIATSRLGNITIKGMAGNGLNGNNIGVVMHSLTNNEAAWSVETENGLLTINGTGGSSEAILGARNFGVSLSGLGSVTTKGSGILEITGQGGGSEISDNNHGIQVIEQARLETKGSGSIKVTGKVAFSNFDKNYGLLLNSDVSGVFTVGVGGILLIDSSDGFSSKQKLEEFVVPKITFANNSVIDCTIDGLIGDDNYDQMRINGAIDISGTSLRITGSYFPFPGDIFTIIKNDGVESIAGEFAGKPQGARLYVGARQFIIRYDGGDGNDLTLQAVVPISPLQNRRSIYDVDDDNTTSPLDVLYLVNALNRYGSTIDVRSYQPMPPYLDVNGDFVVSPIDVLLVVNNLNLKSQGEGELLSERSHLNCNYFYESEDNITRRKRVR